mmetsp:Transcript_145937/g.467845  ORF Transcript_145937/g.467845 Transcript_145937/m.467845 type:complete len:272 (-) Transcript_145937:226-1041(-)
MGPRRPSSCTMARLPGRPGQVSARSPSLARRSGFALMRGLGSLVLTASLLLCVAKAESEADDMVALQIDLPPDVQRMFEEMCEMEGISQSEMLSRWIDSRWEAMGYTDADLEAFEASEAGRAAHSGARAGSEGPCAAGDASCTAASRSPQAPSRGTAGAGIGRGAGNAQRPSGSASSMSMSGSGAPGSAASASSGPAASRPSSVGAGASRPAAGGSKGATVAAKPKPKPKPMREEREEEEDEEEEEEEGEGGVLDLDRWMKRNGGDDEEVE